MPLDINAFRSIAAQSPGRLVYVRGEKLKTAKTQGARGPEVFKAAVDAFIKAYGDHYGAKLGNMSRQSLQEYADGSKPHTASVVKQMLDYADSKIGSAREISVGGATIDISKIGTEKIPFQGFTHGTKTRRAQAGRDDALESVFAAFERRDGDKVDAAALLKALNTMAAFATIEGYVFKSADSVEIARLGDVSMKKFPFLREPIVVGDGLVVMPDQKLRDELAKEAKKLAEATSPRSKAASEGNELLVQMMQAKTDNERFALQDRQKAKIEEGRRLEKEQTDTLSDDEIVELVEKTIRDNPADYPLLTKYYLDAE